MKKTLLLTILFCFALSSFAFAQNKIAVVDIQLIMQQSKAGVKAAGELETLQKNSSAEIWSSCRRKYSRNRNDWSSCFSKRHWGSFWSRLWLYV